MKTFIVFFLIVFGLSKTFAQNLTITFRGAGLTTTVVYVDVKNLKTGTSAIINGADVLNLKGTSSIDNPVANEEPVLIRPNPSEGTAELSFYAIHQGNVCVEVFDLSGKKVIQRNDDLNPGRHHYEISGLTKGTYVVRVNGDHYQYDTKLISNSTQNQPGIKYLGKTDLDNQHNKTLATFKMSFSWGDSMRYIGNSGLYCDTVYDVPVSSKIVTFAFCNLPVISTTNPFNITFHSFTSGGNITSDGGSTITARGICWSDKHFIPSMVNDHVTSEGTGKGIFTSSVSGLQPDQVLYVMAYATNIKGTVFGDVYIFNTKDLAVGDSFQGGIIAYILNSGDPGYVSGQTKGIIAAYTDLSAGATWSNGSMVKTNATNTAVGMGKANTDSIVSHQGAGSYAAMICYNSLMKGYNDWYLPDQDELNKLYSNRTKIGSFTTGTYWSSTEQTTNISNAWALSFTGGTGSYTLKSGANYVRPIRHIGPQDTTPLIVTRNVTSITQINANSGGYFISDGGSKVTARGICWSQNPIPTLADNKTSNGTDTAKFLSAMSGLSIHTKYYVRAYAINSFGTGYGNIISFITEQADAPTVTDFDGNVYDTVHIGSQVWMKQNLKAIHFDNGDGIINISGWEWDTLLMGAYCNYDNLASNGTTYGRLYNYYAVSDPRYICPAGWHVPTDADWTDLTNFLGDSNVAGGKLKETGTSHWTTTNTGATNSSRFTALPGGGRIGFPSSFSEINKNGYWWSSTEDGTWFTLGRSMHNNNTIITTNSLDKGEGYSVRCIKN